MKSSSHHLRVLLVFFPLLLLQGSQLQGDLVLKINMFCSQLVGDLFGHTEPEHPAA